MKYRKKPIIINAVQWNGHNTKDVLMFVAPKDQVVMDNFSKSINNNYLLISTLEGVMRADKGDYIIKGVQGEFYPCKPDIFNETNELVEE